MGYASGNKKCLCGHGRRAHEHGTGHCRHRRHGTNQDGSRSKRKAEQCGCVRYYPGTKEA